jgi:hypothetical protein
MVPYLKGIVHLTIDSWQPHCNEDGWKNISIVEAKCETAEQDKPPQPPKTLVCPTGVVVCLYMFQDASGSGFGISLWVAGEGTIYTAHGSWTLQFAQFLVLRNARRTEEPLQK